MTDTYLLEPETNTRIDVQYLTRSYWAETPQSPQYQTADLPRSNRPTVYNGSAPGQLQVAVVLGEGTASIEPDIATLITFTQPTEATGEPPIVTFAHGRYRFAGFMAFNGAIEVLAVSDEGDRTMVKVGLQFTETFP